jgi:hypothetical protein
VDRKIPSSGSFRRSGGSAGLQKTSKHAHIPQCTIQTGKENVHKKTYVWCKITDDANLQNSLYHYDIENGLLFIYTDGFSLFRAR